MGTRDRFEARDALAHIRSIANAICDDNDVIVEGVTFGEVRELLARLDDTNRLLQAAGRELERQACHLAVAYAQLRKEGP